MQNQEEKDSKNLVSSIITLGQNLNMSIIAEGVEDAAEGKILKDMGCQYAQGYHFARPAPEKDVIEIVSNWENPEI